MHNRALFTPHFRMLLCIPLNTHDVNLVRQCIQENLSVLQKTIPYPTLKGHSFKKFALRYLSYIIECKQLIRSALSYLKFTYVIIVYKFFLFVFFREVCTTLLTFKTIPLEHNASVEEGENIWDSSVKCNKIEQKYIFFLIIRTKERSAKAPWILNCEAWTLESNTPKFISSSNTYKLLKVYKYFKFFGSDFYQP